MLENADLVAFVATADQVRSRAFYGDALGLPVVEESDFATVYDAHGTPLRVTSAVEVQPAPYTVLGWSVADVAATMRELTGRGVVFERYDGLDQDDHGVWTAPDGTRIAWFRDPDGNVLSLTEHREAGQP